MPSEKLTVYKGVRLFAHHEKNYRKYAKKLPGKWNNFSHYLRCALERYQKDCEMTLLDIAFQKQVSKKVKR